MKLNAKVEAIAQKYNPDGGFTKLEYTAIEFMKIIISKDSVSVMSNLELENAAERAVVAARILAGVLQAEEGR